MKDRSDQWKEDQYNRNRPSQEHILQISEMKIIKNTEDVWTIKVPMSEEELQEILHEDKSFEWVFPTMEDEGIEIKVIINKE